VQRDEIRPRQQVVQIPKTIVIPAAVSKVQIVQAEIIPIISAQIEKLLKLTRGE